MCFNINNTSKLIAIILLNLFLTFQNGYTQGIVMDREEVKEYNKLYQEKAIKRGNSLSMLPQSHSLKQFCPTPMDQGSTMICGGAVIAYWSTIREAFQNAWTDQKIINYNRYSEFHAYFAHKVSPKVDCTKEHTKLSKALYFVQNHGIAKTKDLIENLEDCQIEKASMKAAPKYYIQDFAPLFKKDDKVKIKLTQQEIHNGKPVIAIIKVAESFQNLKNDLWQPTESPQKKYSYHAITVVAYDDHYAETGAFQVLNSWGEDWGNKGFGWISYADFGEWVEFAYAIEDYNNWGNISITKCPTPYTMPVVFDDQKKEYTLAVMNNEEVNLKLHNQSNNHFYMFAFPTDPKKNIHAIYPKEACNQKGVSESNPTINFSLGFVEVEKNTDYICAFYTNKKIKEKLFYKKLAEFKTDKQTKKMSLGEQLEMTLQKFDISLLPTKYHSEKIYFEATSQSKDGRVAIPIIIKIQYQNLLGKN